MSFNANQARDRNGKWTGSGAAPATPGDGWPSATTVAAGVAATALAGVALATVSPLASRALGSLAASAGVSIGKELVGAAAGGGIARGLMTRAVGARLGSWAGLPGMVAGALLAPAAEDLITAAVTPRPDVTLGVITTFPKIIQHIAGAR